MAAILTDDIFKCIFLNENDRIPVQISLKFVPRSPINNKAALVQVMAWRRTGDITWTNDDPVHWRIYAAVGGDELMQKRCNSSALAMELHLFYIKPLICVTTFSANYVLTPHLDFLNIYSFWLQ